MPPNSFRLDVIGTVIVMFTKSHSVRIVEQAKVLGKTVNLNYVSPIQHTLATGLSP